MAYLQASGSTTQVITHANKPQRLVIDVEDAAMGVHLNPNEGSAQVEEDGAFLVITAPQVGRLNEGGVENFRCWLKVNKEDVPNSNVLLNLYGSTKDVIVAQAVVDLKKGDEVSVWMAASTGGDVAVEAIKPMGEPLVPSVIFSMLKVS
jgi:hypothetical protein